ncbi:MAG: DUF4173 domain-containing protein [Clostridia bacterium]|nr:DUF4173 domain-containing protein [Clostridia bacterium]
MSEHYEYRFDPGTGEPVAERYSLYENVFAWLSVAAGYGFCRVFPVHQHPFGGFLFILALYLASVILLKLKGASFGMMSLVMGGSALLLSPALFLSANSMIHFLVYLYALAAWFYTVSAACGNTLEKGFSELLFADFFKAIIVMPAASFAKLFSVLFSGKRRTGGKTLLKLLLGIGIAVIPTVVVLALLSYDSAFTALLKKLFDFGWSNILSHAFSFLLGIPIGMYLFAAFFSASRNRCAESFTAEHYRAGLAVFQLLPGISAVAAILPVLLVYLLFFVSQWQYYLSAFTGVLPGGMTFAEYARSGFFQLCTVSVINLIIMILLQVFVRRREEKPLLLTRILSAILSAFTLILIATAIAKLWLYIDRFGLTPKRVYAGWFMIILAVIFVLAAVKQFAVRFKLVPTATLACVVLFGVLALSGSDSLIARYNAERYMNGTLEIVDVSAMEELGDAAVPSMVRLVKFLDRQNGTDIRNFPFDSQNDLYNDLARYLYYDAAQQEPCTFFSVTLPRIRADHALQEAGIEAGKRTDQ